MRARKEISEDIQDTQDQIAEVVIRMVRLATQDGEGYKAEVAACRAQCLRIQGRLYRLMAELADRCAETGEAVNGGPGFPTPGAGADPFAGIEIPDTLDPDDLK